MRLLSILASMSLMLAVATPAEAYRYRLCNDVPLKLPSNNWTIHSANISFPVGYWLDGLNNSISQFNKNPSNFWYSRVSDTNGLGLNNGQSETWGSSDQGILQGAPAIAYSYWDCYWFFGLVAKMKEGDVIFDYTNGAAPRWTATRAPTAISSYSGSGRLLQGTAIHEFGHAIGLLHVNTEYNVMGEDFTHLHTNGGTTNAYIGEDTGDGAAFLYGNWASGPQDASIVHWRRVGAIGEYSDHSRTRILNTNSVELPKEIIGREPRYRVRRNQVIRAEFTHENNGRETLSNVQVRYYISTNNIISTADRWIGTSSWASLTRGNVSTTTTTLTIPGNLVLNTNYWVGAIINPLSTIAESDRTNNATYIGIRVIP